MFCSISSNNDRKRCRAGGRREDNTSIPMVPILTLPSPLPHPIHTILGSGIECKFNDVKYGIVSLRNDKGTSMNDKKKHINDRRKSRRILEEVP